MTAGLACQTISNHLEFKSSNCVLVALSPCDLPSRDGPDHKSGGSTFMARSIVIGNGKTRISTRDSHRLRAVISSTHPCQHRVEPQTGTNYQPQSLPVCCTQSCHVFFFVTAYCRSLRWMTPSCPIQIHYMSRHINVRIGDPCP